MGEEPQQRGERLAALAARQHGVVSIRQLHRLGFDKDAVSDAKVAGRLHRLYHGVYAVGHTNLSLQGQCLAAVLACGPRALLSHYSAAWLWGLSSTKPIPIHVTSPSPRRRRPPIRLHRASKLSEADRAVEDLIPVTSVARTLLDQAALVDERRLRRLLKRSEELRAFDLAAVHDVLGRNRGHRGHKPPEARRWPCTSRRPSPAPTSSRASTRRCSPPTFLAPRVNYVVAGLELDVYWPEHRLGVELDLFETHGTRDSFEEDRLRREDLLLEGVSIVNVTGPRFDREPDAVLARLRTLLGERGAL